MIVTLKFSFFSRRSPSPRPDRAQHAVLPVTDLQPVSKPNSPVGVAALRTVEGNAYFQFDCTALPVPVVSSWALKPFRSVQLLLANPYQNVWKLAVPVVSRSIHGQMVLMLPSWVLSSTHAASEHSTSCFHDPSFCEKVLSGACCFSLESRKYCGFKGFDIS